MFNFRSKITVKLLNYFFLNPENCHYINELSNILEVDPGNLFRKLKELESDGVFVSKKQGNQRFFSLNKNYVLLKELKKAFKLKFGLVNFLQESLKSLKGLEEAYLYGSFSKGKAVAESDIDVLLIGNHKSLAAVKCLNVVQKQFKREVNTLDMTKKEFEKKKKEDFLKNVFKDNPIKIF